jgi:hypothetical protein
MEPERMGSLIGLHLLAAVGTDVDDRSPCMVGVAYTINPFPGVFKA